LFDIKISIDISRCELENKKKTTQNPQKPWSFQSTKVIFLLKLLSPFA